MTKIIVALFVLMLSGCYHIQTDEERQAAWAKHIEAQKIDALKDCRRVTIDGLECLVCFKHINGSSWAAPTCNWNPK